MSESSFAARSSAAPAPCFACLYRPPAPQSGGAPTDEEHGPVSLIQIAEEFSSRFEQHREDLVSIDVSGLERLLGPPRVIGEAVRRTLAARGVRAHVAI